jgi:hypothetical protein
MKTMMKRTAKGEKGSVLPLALVLLVLGGVILAPLLGLMSTGLLAGQVYEGKMGSYYAADAGVEDAISKIKGDVPDSYPYVYPEPLVVNGDSVGVTIFRQDLDPTCGEELRYRILSTVITDDGGETAAIVNGTTIDAHLSVSYLDLSSLLDYAIVSNNTVEVQPNNQINGDVWLPDKEDLELGSHVSVNGTVYNSTEKALAWPDGEALSAYYLGDVQGACDPGSFIDIKDLNPKTIGPWHREGSLAVDNLGDPVTIVLEDTVYVTGDLEFWQPADGHNYTINLNGQALFAEGSISFASQHVSISGSGCIIAVGDVNFQPAVTSGGDDFVLVMSITGQTYFHPSGDFTGCIVGDSDVQLQPGCTIDWVSPEGKGLNVPWGVGDNNELPPVTGLTIESWEIS